MAMTYHQDLGEPRGSEEQQLLERRDALMDRRAADAKVAARTAYFSDLSVKPYVVSGVNVWASYQSPTADTEIKRMKQELNRFGSGLDVNGMVGPKTTSALKQIASRYSGAQGLTGAKVRRLAQIAAGPDGSWTGPGTRGSEEQIARRAREVWDFVYDLAEEYGFIKKPAVATSPKKGEGGKATIPPPPPGTTPPPPGGGGMGVMAILKSPIGLAALAVGAVLVYRSMSGGGSSRSRKTKRVRALAHA
jgi:hypothetical protein